MALFAIARAAFGYLFLVLMVRIVGRRPGKQLTPFEFVLVFYLGGLTLTGMVGNEASLTSAITQILTVAVCHYGLAALRFRNDTFAQLFDGTPLILLEGDRWRSETMSRMRLQDDDVMDMAREQGLPSLKRLTQPYSRPLASSQSSRRNPRKNNMSTQAPTKPVEDSVSKVDDKVAAGENLDFQRKWWKFERAIWIFFLLVLIADVLGLFGRGWLAKARRSDSAQTLTVDYERVARASTPSVMTLHFGPNAIRDGHIELYVSDSIVKPLGAQRISPQPARSTIGNDGITYTFDATQLPASAQIALEPSFPGRHPFRVQVLGGDPIDSSILVVP